MIGVKLTTAEVDSQLRDGWKRLGEYKNASSKVLLLCPSGHEVSIKWDHYQRGTGCKFCSGVAKLTNEDIDERLDPGWKRITDYVNNHTHLMLLCPNGHIVWMQWQNYQQGKRCVHCFKKMNRGETHRSWKPDLPVEVRERRGRKNLQYKEWRIAVYRRDGFTCQVCGEIGENLCAHHLHSFRENEQLRYAVDNGITLCKQCHIRFHRTYGAGGNTPEQFDEYRRKMLCR